MAEPLSDGYSPWTNLIDMPLLRVFVLIPQVWARQLPRVSRLFTSFCRLIVNFLSMMSHQFTSFDTGVLSAIDTAPITLSHQIYPKG